MISLVQCAERRGVERDWVGPMCLGSSPIKFPKRMIADSYNKNWIMSGNAEETKSIQACNVSVTSVANQIYQIWITTAWLAPTGAGNTHAWSHVCILTHGSRSKFRFVQCRAEDTGAIKQLHHLQRPPSTTEEWKKNIYINIVSTNGQVKLILWPFAVYHCRCVWTRSWSKKANTKTSLQCVTAMLQSSR